MRRVAIAGLVTVMALGGCGARSRPAPPSQPLGALPTAAALFDALAARRAAVHGLRAWARLSYVSPEESRRAKQLLIAERPDRLRMELFSPFGAVFVLAAADGTLAAYVRDEATVYRGTDSPANLERYTQIDLPVAGAVDLLLGTPPVDDAAGGVVSADGGTVKLWQETPDGAAAAWFSPSLEPLRYERHDVDGGVLLRASFARYAEADGMRVPDVVAIELPPTQRRIDITLSETEINPALPDAVFALQTPPGSREIDLDLLP